MGIISWLLADVLVVLGVFIMTVRVYGMVRLPDTYTRLHATSKAAVLGVISLLAASVVTSVVTGDPEIVYRVFLISVCLVLTTSLSAHVIARAAYWRGEEMESPGAVDESDKDLAGG